MVKRRRVVDEERHLVHRLRRFDDAAGNPPRALRRGGCWSEETPDFSAMIRVASCSADISMEKNATRCRVRRSTDRLRRLGGVEADIGGERGLAHRGAAGEDDQVRRLQAAQLAVEDRASRW